MRPHAAMLTIIMVTLPKQLHEITPIMISFVSDHVMTVCFISHLILLIQHLARTTCNAYCLLQAKAIKGE